VGAVHPGRAGGALALPDEVGVPIHEDDIAAVAALAIAAAIGEDVRLEVVGRDEALRQLQEQGGWAAANGPFVLGYEGYSPGVEPPEFTEAELPSLPTVERVTGRPARSFAQWARDHAGDFR
jgi:hypothetical protein